MKSAGFWTMQLPITCRVFLSNFTIHNLLISGKFENLLAFLPKNET